MLWQRTNERVPSFHRKMQSRHLLYQQRMFCSEKKFKRPFQVDQRQQQIKCIMENKIKLKKIKLDALLHSIIQFM